MVKITKSDIQALLDNYHNSINNASPLPFSFRAAAGSLPKILANLEVFITKLNSPLVDSNELTLEQTYQLTTILLGRKTRLGLNIKEKLSEDLVKKFEIQFFSPDEFSELKRHFDSNTLDLDKFITVCKLSSVIPQAFDDPKTHAVLMIEKSLSEKMALSQISRHYRSLFTNENTAHLPLLRQLLSHGALGELEQAEGIWRKHPDLLTCYRTIYHPNCHYKDNEAVGDIPFHHNPGRYKFNLTYLQILWVNEEYEEAKIIEDILGSTEVTKQFFEVFPDGVIKKDNFDLAHANTLLNVVFKAIVNDNTINTDNLDRMNEDTRAALYALHNYAKSEFEHKTGLVFDHRFYLAALELYDKQAVESLKQNTSKHDFWFIRVEEWLAGCLATGYLRPHAQGVSNDLVHRRGCLMEDGSSYFAFRRENHSIPGLNSFMGVYWKVAAPHRAARKQRLSTLMSNKKHLREQLMQSCNSFREVNPRPVK